MKDTIHALAHVQRELKKLADENASFLVSSRADSYDEYKKVCGVIRGLSLADNIINDLVQKMEKSDDD